MEGERDKAIETEKESERHGTMNGLYDLITSGAITREEYEKRVYHYQMMDRVKETITRINGGLGTGMDEAMECTCTRTSVSPHSKSGLSIEVREYLAKIPTEMVNLADEEGNTLFLLVCQISETDAMRMLIETPGLHGCLHNKAGQHALLFASIQGFKTLVMKLIRCYPYQAFSPTSRGHIPLYVIHGMGIQMNTLEAICYHLMTDVLHVLLRSGASLSFHGGDESEEAVVGGKSAFMWVLLRGGERMSRKIIMEIYAHFSFGEGLTHEMCTMYLQEMLLVEYSRNLVEPILLTYPANLMAPVMVGYPERTLFDAVCERFPDLAPACIHLHGVPANIYHPNLDENLYEMVEAECAICMEVEKGHFVTCGNARCQKTVHVKCWKEFLLSQQVRHMLDDRRPHHIERVQCVCCRDSDMMYFAIDSSS